ncbi:MAG: type IX secretion system PorP/SprF family membrane protein [Paraglaciecola sp.]|jgi:type IX secretion system PorP/SprF family membrane protein
MDRLQLMLISILLLVFLNVNAQQLPLFTQYREYQTILNPAAIGSSYFAHDQNLTFGASYRNQWTGLKNGPTTAILRGEYLYENTGFSLLSGGYILHDETGPTSNTGVYGRIGGVISPDPYYGGISVGLTGGIVQYRVNGEEITLREQGDILDGESQSKISPDVGFGIYAYKYVRRGDYVYGGISVPQVLGLDLSYQTDNGEFQTQRIQHMYAMAGYLLRFKDESFVEPTVWAKYVKGADVNIDFNFRYQMQSTFWIGIGGSTSKAVHAEAGILLGNNAGLDNTIRIGYGYDYNFSSFGPFAGPSHEINISYSLDR